MNFSQSACDAEDSVKNNRFSFRAEKKNYDFLHRFALYCYKWPRSMSNSLGDYWIFSQGALYSPLCVCVCCVFVCVGEGEQINKLRFNNQIMLQVWNLSLHYLWIIHECNLSWLMKALQCYFLSFPKPGMKVRTRQLGTADVTAGLQYEMWQNAVSMGGMSGCIHTHTDWLGGQQELKKPLHQASNKKNLVHIVQCMAIIKTQRWFHWT